MYKADSYSIEGSGNEWKSVIWQGHNIVDTLEAKSEKQAHFLAKQKYPEALTPHAHDKLADKEYDSPEGRAWRRKQRSAI